jgi:hypothetical protein
VVFGPLGLGVGQVKTGKSSRNAAEWIKKEGTLEKEGKKVHRKLKKTEMETNSLV